MLCRAMVGMIEVAGTPRDVGPLPPTRRMTDPRSAGGAGCEPVGSRLQRFGRDADAVTHELEHPIMPEPLDQFGDRLGPLKQRVRRTAD